MTITPSPTLFESFRNFSVKFSKNWIDFTNDESHPWVVNRKYFSDAKRMMESTVQAERICGAIAALKPFNAKANIILEAEEILCNEEFSDEDIVVLCNFFLTCSSMPHLFCGAAIAEITKRPEKRFQSAAYEFISRYIVHPSGVNSAFYHSNEIGKDLSYMMECNPLFKGATTISSKNQWVTARDYFYGKNQDVTSGVLNEFAYAISSEKNKKNPPVFTSEFAKLFPHIKEEANSWEMSERNWLAPALKSIKKCDRSVFIGSIYRYVNPLFYHPSSVMIVNHSLNQEVYIGMSLFGRMPYDLDFSGTVFPEVLLYLLATHPCIESGIASSISNIISFSPPKK